MTASVSISTDPSFVVRNDSAFIEWFTRKTHKQVRANSR
jgi:hypothetical protein